LQVTSRPLIPLETVAVPHDPTVKKSCSGQAWTAASFPRQVARQVARNCLVQADRFSEPGSSLILLTTQNMGVAGVGQPAAARFRPGSGWDWTDHD